MIPKQDKKNISNLLILIIMLIAGIFVRLNGFDSFGFSSSDEYYIIKSVKNILQRGLPEFETGGYYVRGILYQYLSAGLLLIGVKDVAALRIITILFNILSVPALYLIAKRIINPTAALIVCFLFIFSVWEIEYSRVARFYTPFQAIFLWYVYFLMKVILDKEYKSYKWLYLLSILSIFIYEGAIFLIILNFLPNFLYKNKNHLLLTSVIFVLSFIYLTTNFRGLGVENTLPTDIEFERGGSSAPIYLPHLLIFQLVLPKGEISWIAFLTLLIAIFGAIVFRTVKRRSLEPEQLLYFLTIGLLAILNLYGILLLLLIGLLLSRRMKINMIKSSEYRFLGGFVLLSLIFWFIYTQTNQEWLTWLHKSSFSAKNFAWLTFNYPNFYQELIEQWVYTFPIMSFILFTSLAVFTVFCVMKEKDDLTFSFLPLVLLILIAIVSIVVTPYQSARYSFFLYPLLFTVMIKLFYPLSGLMKKLRLRQIVYAVLIFLFFYLSEDHNLNHILNINTREIMYRENYPKRLAGIYYYKEDYKSTGEFISQNLLFGDLIVSTIAPVEYYLPRLDYYFRDYRDKEFTARSREKGKTEVWTNSKLIYKESVLRKLIENSDQRIWLITYSDKRPGVSGFEKELHAKYSEYKYYTNPDGSLNVYLIGHQRMPSSN